MELLKHFKHIKPFKEEMIQRINLPKPDGPLACLMQQKLPIVLYMKCLMMALLMKIAHSLTVGGTYQTYIYSCIV